MVLAGILFHFILVYWEQKRQMEINSDKEKSNIPWIMACIQRDHHHVSQLVWCHCKMLHFIQEEKKVQQLQSGEIGLFNHSCGVEMDLLGIFHEKEKPAS